MTRIKVTELEWDAWNLEHIKKHGVSQVEVEEAITRVKAYRKGYEGRVVLIGRSGTRILACLVKKQRLGKYYIVTARDADKKERRLLYENEKK